MKENNSSISLKTFFILLVFIVLGIFLRSFVLLSSYFKELNYEEAMLGLQAINVLKGHFTSFLIGQSYIGSLGVFLNAFFFKIFGATILTLRFVPLMFSVFIFLSAAYISFKLFGEKICIITTIIFSIPPFFMIFISSIAYEGCLGSIFFLLWAFYFSCIILLQNNHERFKYFIFGFLLGLSFWEHSLSIPTIIAFCICFLWDLKYLIFRVRIIYILSGFILGCLPLLLWNFTHDFLSFKCILQSSNNGNQINFFSDLYETLVVKFPILFGKMNNFWGGYGTEIIFSALLFTLYLIFAIFFIVIFFNFLVSIFKKFSISYETILFIIVLTNIYFFIVNGRSDSKYLIPLYLSIPFLWTYFINWLFLKKRSLAFVLIFLILFLHVHDNFQFFMYDQQKNHKDISIQKVITFLKDQNINYAYANYKLASKITFESTESVICADYYSLFKHNLFSEIYGDIDIPRKYLSFVDNAKSCAFITYSSLNNPSPKKVEQNLILLGASYKKMAIGDYVVFYDLKRNINELILIEKNHLSATSNNYENNIVNIFDRNIETKWESKQDLSCFIEIDLEKEIVVEKLTLEAGDAPHNLPESFYIFKSNDGFSWNQLLTVNNNKEFKLLKNFDWFGNKPRSFQDGKSHLYFPRDTKTRFIKLVPAKVKDGVNFTIYELYVYTSNGKSFIDVEKATLDILSDKLNSINYDKIYSKPYLSSKIDTLKLKNSKKFSILGLHEKNKQNRYIDFRKINVFILSSNDYQEFEDIIKPLLLKYKKNIINNLYLYTFAPIEHPVILYFSDHSVLYTNASISVLPYMYEREQRSDKKDEIDNALKAYLMELSTPCIFYYPAYKSLSNILNQYDFQSISKKHKHFIDAYNNIIFETYTGIRLHNFYVSKSIIKGKKYLNVSYYFSITMHQDRNYAVSLNLIDEDDNIIFKDNHFILDGKLSFENINIGEIVRESYSLKIPEDITIDNFIVAIGLLDTGISNRFLKIKEATSKNEIKGNKLIIRKIDNI